MRKHSQLTKAIELYEDFTGHIPENLDYVEIPAYEVGIRIGKVLGVMYETVRDGKREKYLHEFKKNSRPVLAVSFDGKQLYMLSGAYQFTDRGIEDG